LKNRKEKVVNSTTNYCKSGAKVFKFERNCQVLPEGTFNLMKIYIILEKPANISNFLYFGEIPCFFTDNSNKLQREVFPDESSLE